MHPLLKHCHHNAALVYIKSSLDCKLLIFGRVSERESIAEIEFISVNKIFTLLKVCRHDNKVCGHPNDTPL